MANLRGFDAAKVMGQSSSLNRVEPLQRARSALAALDPNCDRDNWVRTGMGAHAAGLSFDDFDNWSQGGKTYNARDCQAVWKSFKAGPVTEATLFKMAKDSGWCDEPGASNAIVPVARFEGAVPQPSRATSAENVDAIRVLGLCTSASASHPYIAKKRGTVEGLFVYPVSAPPLSIAGQHVGGFLAVPCWDGAALQTIQFIPPTGGSKVNLPGAAFGDGYFEVGCVGDATCLYIVEGIGQAWAVHSATGAAAVVCFGASRMARVAAALRTKYPYVRLVLVADRGKEPQVQSIAADINGGWCEMPADKPTNYDANDYALEFGYEALSALLDGAKNSPLRYRLMSAADLCSLPPLRWTVRGVLPADGLAALYGPSGSGKSFLVLDIAAAVAGGVYEWFGRRVTQCPVTYCALEGEGGVGKRLQAWSHHHGKPIPGALRFVAQPFSILETGDVDELAKAVQAAGGAGGMVIVDTLNRAAPGADENSSADMGRIISSAKRLQAITGGLVLLVHHTGKDATKGPRGHSSLFASLDGAIEVTRTAETQRQWHVAKSKDDATGETYSFALQVVRLGYDDEGEEITSCVIVNVDFKDQVKRVRLPQGGNQKLVLEALRPLFIKGVTGKPNAPALRPCIELEKAVAAGATSLTCPTDKRTSRARDAITGLISRGVMGCHDGWLWLT